MASTFPVSTRIERDVESSLKVVMHSLISLVRMCEDLSIPQTNRSRLEWRAATLRDARRYWSNPSQLPSSSATNATLPQM